MIQFHNSLCEFSAKGTWPLQIHKGRYVIIDINDSIGHACFCLPVFLSPCLDCLSASIGCGLWRWANVLISFSAHPFPQVSSQLFTHKGCTRKLRDIQVHHEASSLWCSGWWGKRHEQHDAYTELQWHIEEPERIRVYIAKSVEVYTRTPKHTKGK